MTSDSKARFEAVFAYALEEDVKGTGLMFHSLLAWSMGALISPKISKIRCPTPFELTGVVLVRAVLLLLRLLLLLLLRLLLLLPLLVL